jgi:hypothetical protein
MLYDLFHTKTLIGLQVVSEDYCKLNQLDDIYAPQVRESGILLHRNEMLNLTFPPV